MDCTAKHTVWQPKDSEWRCPKCGIDARGLTPKGDDTNTMGFIIEESDPVAYEDCPQLHEKDRILCDNCGYHVTGIRLVKAYAKVQNLVTCAHCKGRGLVPAKKRGT